MRRKSINNSLFFEQLPDDTNELGPNALVDEVDRLMRLVYSQQSDPEGLSKTLDQLSVRNVGLGNLLVEALDLARQAETSYNYEVNKKKLALTKQVDPNTSKTHSATVAESMAEVEHHQKKEEWDGLKKSVDTLRIKRADLGQVIDTHRSRLSLIKGDIQRG